ncbi:hypothetical protein [Candidatus Albibeggiatoa sp. nov. BB20]|uniref:hypothetical protein n=1 Tax=Candidatus Albibeggiatoa sp. nov. BB20 TaxID=3162723 RepID=UPI0033658A5D
MANLEYWTDKISNEIKKYDEYAQIEVTQETYEGEDAYVLVNTVLDELYLMRQVVHVQGEASLDDYFIVVLPTQIKKAAGM